MNACSIRLPWVLSTPVGLKRNINKARFANCFQKKVTEAAELPGNSASVVNTMNLVTRIKGYQATLGEVV